MNEITTFGFGKINLILNVFEGSPFHPLETIICPTLDLFDKITLKKSSEFSLSCPFVENEKNIVTKIFHQLEKFLPTPFSCKIEKNVPVMGGLGGSSCDGKGVLEGLKILFDLDDSLLFSVAESLGSDIPPLLAGGVTSSFGKDMKKPPRKICENLGGYALIVSDGDKLSTSEVFKAFDSLDKRGEKDEPKDFEVFEKKVLEKDFEFLKSNLWNMLERPCFSISGLEEKIARAEKLTSSKWLLSGSGGCFFSIVESFDEAMKNKEVVSKHFAKSWVTRI